MANPTPLFRRVRVAACVALLVSCLIPAAGVAHAGGASPAPAAVDGDTYVIVPASAELQLLSGPGISPTGSVAPTGTTQWVGKRASGRPVVSRLFYSFDLSGLPAEAITSVTLEHWQIYSPNRTCFLDSYGPAVQVVTTEAPASQPSWPGPATTSDSAESGYALGSQRECVPHTSQTWEVTDMVRTAAEASSTVHLRLASADETQTSGYRRYASEGTDTPSLRVFLRAHPDVPTHLTVEPVAPNSPASPVTIASDWATFRAELTTPGGCRGTTELSSCLSARYEVTAPDGTVVFAGQNDSLWSAEGVGYLKQSVGPLDEDVNYLVKVWGLNTQNGLESLEPATLTIRYNAPPSAPALTVPSWFRMGQPMQVTATAGDADAAQVCWLVVVAETPWEGCSPIAPHEPTVITLGTSDIPTSVNGSLWVVDDLGTRGPGAAIQAAVIW